MGHNPWNTQALLQEAETGVSVSLQDVNRVLTMELIYIELLGPHDTHEDPVESTEEVNTFREALHEAEERLAYRVGGCQVERTGKLEGEV